MQPVSLSMHMSSREARGRGRGPGKEETSNDVNHILLKTCAKNEISGMHEARCHHYATTVR